MSEYLVQAPTAPLAPLGHGPPRPRGRRERFVVRLGQRIELVGAAEVDFLRAADNYVRLYCPGRRHVVRATLSGLEAELDPDVFVRIHRSTIVNVTRLKELRPRPTGDWDVILVDGTRLVLSRRYRAAFAARIERAGIRREA